MEQPQETVPSIYEIRQRNFTNFNQRYCHYDIGDYTYGEPDVLSWGEETTLSVGKYCSIADNVTIFLGGEHRIDWVTTYPFSAIYEEASSVLGHPATKGNVIIGNDVWIGYNATILSGITIGDGSVIAAGAVVTHDVPDYGIVGGNPAKLIRMRFSDEEISSLLKIAWWNWSQEKIKSKYPLLLSKDISQFINEFSGD